MDQLTLRQQQILALIVTSYIETVAPVGSVVISQKFNRDISSATIRNDMVTLEEAGYITHPHTSAGRIPTDKGYRLYVDSLLKAKAVDPSEAGLIAREYRQRINNIEELIERTSKILSFLTEQAGIVVYPSEQDLVLKKIQLIAYGSSHLIVVVIATNGMVFNKIVNMDEEITEQELIRLNHFLNSELPGCYYREIGLHLDKLFSETKDSLARQFAAVRHLLADAFECEKSRKLSLDGSRFVLKQPEFQGDAIKARLFFKALESRDAFQELFHEQLLPGEVRVKIGSENTHRDIWDCTLVTSQYFFRNQSLGTLGVLGPKRMPYARVISLVHHVAMRLSDAFDQLAD